MTEINLCFAHNYRCEILEELPGGPVAIRHFEANGGQRDGLVVRLEPEGREPWIGMFAFGKFRADVNQVLSTPDPDRVCVVAGGAGYLVSVIHPDEWEAVRLTPIVGIQTVPTVGLIVFASHTKMVAFGAGGVKWRTKRLAWDGLKILNITGRTVVGEYWDIRSDALQRFEVDLDTGAAGGGVED